MIKLIKKYHNVIQIVKKKIAPPKKMFSPLETPGTGDSETIYMKGRGKKLIMKQELSL